MSVLTLYFPITWLVQGENHPPLSFGMHGCLFKLIPEHCFVSTQNRCHMDWWSARLVLTHHHFHQHQLTFHQNPQKRDYSFLGSHFACFSHLIYWLSRKKFQLIVYVHCFLVPCPTQIWVICSYSVQNWLCPIVIVIVIIVILEMYSRYFNPLNNIITVSHKHHTSQGSCLIPT